MFRWPNEWPHPMLGRYRTAKLQGGRFKWLWWVVTGYFWRRWKE